MQAEAGNYPGANERSNWRKAKRFRLTAFLLAAAWLALFYAPGEPRPEQLSENAVGWTDAYRFMGLLGVSALCSVLGFFGLTGAFRGRGCWDLSLSLFALPIATLFILTCGPSLQHLIIAAVLGDILLASLLPPGMIVRMLYELWLQMKQQTA